jgi:RHS repeat-associated protein
VATLHPNHTYEKVVFDPWRQTTYDVNDTVAAHGAETGDPRTDPDIAGYTAVYFKTQPDTWQTWHQQRVVGAKGAQEQGAAVKAAKHANTPTTVHFDTLGRPFLTLQHNGFGLDGTPIQFSARVHLDVEGNQREVRDAVEQDGDAQGRVVMRYDYDLLGNRIHQASMEAGERWMLNDVVGTPIRAWDSRGHAFSTEYDPLRRPLRSFVAGVDPADPDQEILTERLVYGEQHPQGELRNLRGQLYLHLDQAGMVTNEDHDFKGNLLRGSRRLAREYKQAIDWTAVDAVLPTDATAKLDLATLEAALAPHVETETFSSRTSYDALNRPVQAIPARSDQPGAKRNVIQPVYNEADLLERLDVWLDHPSEPAGLLDATTALPSAVGVTNIDYDAKGQRLRIDYKNGLTTRHAYDPETFRMIHLLTARNASTFPDDCSQPPPPGWPGCAVQNMHYTYDPVGNITHIRDDAQQTIYFRNRRVEPSADYTYDALYRLVEATGREHLGQIGGTPIPHSHDDQPRVGIDWSGNDGNAMGSYVEQYVYDAVGNVRSMQHRGSDPVHPGWSRGYAYHEASLIEPAKQSNRLSSTTVGGNSPIVEPYAHDAHGNMIRMPHLADHPDPQAANMHWDHRDQLRQSDLGGGGTVYYTYDAAGQRTRKVWEKAPGLTEQRIYLGGFEVFRRRNGTGTVTLQRETLHVMDDQQRIALVETRTQGSDPAPQQLIRYQLGNHLGSVSLELDDQGHIISYEEYTPYGSTSYQAVRSHTETPRRYRYTGKERDEETGFCYHGARYRAPWTGRWTSCDAVGLVDGLNLYSYARANPVRLGDPSGNQSDAELNQLQSPPPAQETISAPLDEPSWFEQQSREANQEAALREGAKAWARQVAADRVEGGRSPATDFSAPGEVHGDLAGQLAHNNAAWEAGEADRARVRHFYGRGLSTPDEDGRMWQLAGNEGRAPIGYGYYGPRTWAEAGHATGVDQVEKAALMYGGAKWLAARALRGVSLVAEGELASRGFFFNEGYQVGKVTGTQWGAPLSAGAGYRSALVASEPAAGLQAIRGVTSGRPQAFAEGFIPGERPILGWSHPQTTNHPLVQEALDQVVFRSRFHGNCAELDVLDRALTSGADMRLMSLDTRFVLSRARVFNAPPCTSCSEVLSSMTEMGLDTSVTRVQSVAPWWQQYAVGSF